MVYVATAATLLWLLGAALTVLTVWFGGSWWRFRQYYRRKGLPLPDGPTWAARLHHWFTEATSLIAIHVWRLEQGPPRLAPPASGRTVLCIHGFTQDRTNFSALRRRLWMQGRPSIAVNLGLPGKHPRKLALVVLNALEQLADEREAETIDIVCHSMGGLVLRDALARRPELARGIACIVTLGSPHHGTAAARWPVRMWPEAGGLARGSEWIEALPTLAEAAPAARTVTIGGSADYIVYPLSSCHLPGSEHVDVHGLGHAGLLTDHRILDTVLAAFDGEALPDFPGVTHPGRTTGSPPAPGDRTDESEPAAGPEINRSGPRTRAP